MDTFDQTYSGSLREASAFEPFCHGALEGDHPLSFRMSSAGTVYVQNT